MIADTLCVTSWRARPVSFVSLMTLYESNFIRLRALAGDVKAIGGAHVSRVAGDCDLHLDLVQHSPYTSILRLTYWFDEPAGTVADPDLEVRVYHDARLVEATHCGRWVRHPSLEAIRSSVGAALGERWLRNMLLNKWLDYCTERGHRFTAATAVRPVVSADEPPR